MGLLFNLWVPWPRNVPPDSCGGCTVHRVLIMASSGILEISCTFASLPCMNFRDGVEVLRIRASGRGSARNHPPPKYPSWELLVLHDGSVALYLKRECVKQGGKHTYMGTLTLRTARSPRILKHAIITSPLHMCMCMRAWHSDIHIHKYINKY